MLKPKYYIDKNNSFVIENYCQAPTFSSFLPGIAGVFGCPMWAFYANRGQAIASCGVQDKDGAIMEFQSANKAYRTTALTGFRTFIKVGGSYYEPFSDISDFPKKMKVTPYSLSISEKNQKLKIEVEVEYFTVANENFPALARTIKIKSLTKKTRTIEVIDGLPIIVPLGFDNALLKNISRTIEAWCAVSHLDQETAFYKLKIMPADVCETKPIEKGNFYTASSNQGKVHLITFPKAVFGETSNFEEASIFKESLKFNLPKEVCTEGFTPCALVYKKAKINELEIFTLVGQAENAQHLEIIKKLASKKGFFGQKFQENKDLIEGLTSSAQTNSASLAFDLYTKQTFLDNVMRGGMPYRIDHHNPYVYYRKHGDMERDYNDFKLIPSYFSQGTGNYRDINQNRRNDVFFYPDTGIENIIRFFNLTQLDGYNPLIVMATKYYLTSVTQANELVGKHIADPAHGLAESLCQPFILGDRLRSLKYKTSLEDFSRELLTIAASQENAAHGEGFWIDHFFYNTDLLESYECIYPDKVMDLLFKEKIFTFFDNDHVVLPRQERYSLCEKEVRQYSSVKTDKQKQVLINSRPENKNLVRANFGKGEIYTTTLFCKILCAIANKAASFDPSGIGLEMEAEKPDWYDALNGLPGLMGSSLSETLELKRIAGYLLNKLSINAELTIAIEIKEFIEQLDSVLANAKDDLGYWQESNNLKEAFRENTKSGLSGEETNLDPALAQAFLQKVIDKCGQAVKNCLARYKTYVTYFINQAAEYENNHHGIEVKSFTQKPLPLFLEGFVHALKVEQDKSIYRKVKQSALYDKKLKMYKVNAPLNDAPLEIGRARVFTPGWLENESIWMHMEYKYMLELIKAGLYKEFFADFKNVLVPFMDPNIYKRSVLENSSFIVSSANPNKHNHGRGFVARLSGAAAEFLDMWVIMTTGKQMFTVDKNKKLIFKLAPILPSWLFKDKQFKFKLLGGIDATYIMPNKKNTFDKGLKVISYKLLLENNEELDINSSQISEPYSQLIRDRKIKSLSAIIG